MLRIPFLAGRLEAACGSQEHPQCKLFDELIKKYLKVSSLEIADVYKAFEDLEVLLAKAHNDPDLDKVVQLGANCGIFILGKYYAKHAIATSTYLYCLLILILTSSLL